MTIDEKTPKQSCEVVKVEDAGLSEADVFLQSYPLLRDKSKDELDRLNKAVLKKLDWKFLVMITLMLLMKYEPLCVVQEHTDTDVFAAISTASMSPTLDSLACNGICT